MSDTPARRAALRTAAIMLMFTLVFTAFMAGTRELTQPAIEVAARAAQQQRIDELLPPGSYDNDLLADALVLAHAPGLGLPEGARVWRARNAGAPVAAVLQTAAPDGYSGRIELLVAVGADARVRGVRVSAHRETPGLGDYIDPRHDRRRPRPWISQFEGRALGDPPAAAWVPRKDGGEFDYVTGATISARAVTRAVARALAWAAAQGPALYHAPAGAYRETTVAGAAPETRP